MTVAHPPSISAFSESHYAAEDFLGWGSAETIDIAGKTPTLLFLHGLGSTPREGLVLAELAAEQGFAFRAPLLPGHGTTIEKLAKSSYQDWLNCAGSHFEELRQKGPVVCAGLSTGSVLAAELAANHPTHCAGLIMLSSATRLDPISLSIPLQLAQFLRIRGIIQEKGAPNINDPEGRIAHLCYNKQSADAAMQINQAGPRVLKRLGDIKAPVFLAHGLKDQVCPKSNVEEIAKLLPKAPREIFLCPESGHILTWDFARHHLKRRIELFIRSL